MRNKLFTRCKICKDLVTLTTSWVVLPQTKEASFATIAALTFYIFFAEALATQSVTQTTTKRTSWLAVACCNINNTSCSNTGNSCYIIVIVA